MMGLDSIWDVDQEVTFEPELELVGGIFSGNGQGSFRGKVYSSLILGITGVSLYQEVIDNQTVREMAAKLQETPYDDKWGSYPGSLHKFTAEEYADLQRMFLKYAEAGASLIGSW